MTLFHCLECIAASIAFTDLLRNSGKVGHTDTGGTIQLRNPYFLISHSITNKDVFEVWKAYSLRSHDPLPGWQTILACKLFCFKFWTHWELKRQVAIVVKVPRAPFIPSLSRFVPLLSAFFNNNPQDLPRLNIMTNSSVHLLLRC